MRVLRSLIDDETTPRLFGLSTGVTPKSRLNSRLNCDGLSVRFGIGADESPEIKWLPWFDLNSVGQAVHRHECMGVPRDQDLLVVSIAVARAVQPRRLTVPVGPQKAVRVGTTDRVIQAAFDYVAPLGGGTVCVLPGVYWGVQHGV